MKRSAINRALAETAAGSFSLSLAGDLLYCERLITLRQGPTIPPHAPRGAGGDHLPALLITVRP